MSKGREWELQPRDFLSSLNFFLKDKKSDAWKQAGAKKLIDLKYKLYYPYRNFMNIRHVQCVMYKCLNPVLGWDNTNSIPIPLASFVMALTSNSNSKLGIGVPTTMERNGTGRDSILNRYKNGQIYRNWTTLKRLGNSPN